MSKNSVFESLCENKYIDLHGREKKKNIVFLLRDIEQQIKVDKKSIKHKNNRIIELNKEIDRLHSELFDGVHIVDKINTPEIRIDFLKQKQGRIRVCFDGHVKVLEDKINGKNTDQDQHGHCHEHDHKPTPKRKVIVQPNHVLPKPERF